MSTLTKVFIVLQLIFSLALSVMVVMVVGSQPKYKDQVEAWQKIAIAGQVTAASKALEAQNYLAQLSQSGADLKAAVVAANDERAKVTTQLADKEKVIAGLTAQIASLTTAAKTESDTIQSVQTSLVASQAEYNKAHVSELIEMNKAADLTREIDKLTQERDQLTRALRRTQEELANLNTEFEDFKNKPKGTASVGSGTASVNSVNALEPQPAINGPIARVDAKDGRTYFTIGLGTRDGIQNGMAIVVARGQTYIGDAEIVRSTVDQSVAVIKILNRNQTVMAGDVATVTR